MNIDEMKDRIARAEEIQRYTENRCEALEKENAELKRHIKADCIDCADYYKNKRLEKENAELKKRVDNLYNSDCWASDQLTKAKDLLEELYDCIPSSSADYYKETLQKVADFLKDSEVEK